MKVYSLQEKECKYIEFYYHLSPGGEKDHHYLISDLKSPFVNV